MPKYTRDKVAGYWLYYTSACLAEGIIHVHANDSKPNRKDAAKIWVHDDGTTTVAEYGKVPKKDMAIIQQWIYDNFSLIKQSWLENGLGGEFKAK